MKHGLRILVVDDSQDSADTVAMLLEAKGYEASAAYDAQGALDCLREQALDVAILDLELPGMSGYELARELRQRSERTLLIIALTGHALDDDDQLSKSAFDHHLLKPLDIDKLSGMLDAFERL
jgi:CheY-like chemotaxis protein